MPLTRAYRDGKMIAEGFPIAEISDYLAQPDTTVWFDLLAPGHEKLLAISEELDLHPLAVEDAEHPHQRPKVDRYRSHLFLTAYAARMEEGQAVADEIAAFITARALVTVRKSDRLDIGKVIEAWDGADAELAAAGVSFLVHGLLDYIVDSHFEVIQSLENEVDQLEEQLFAENVRDTQMQRRAYDLRKSLVTIRRVANPMREVVNTLLRRDLHVVDARSGPYFQDIYDHVLRATEWTESLRDLLGNLYETHLTLRGNRLNVIMKQVTSWAAIIAVPTAITGFYGQNVPFPGFGRPLGFWTSSVLTAVLAVTLYILFKRKDWL